MRIKTNSLVFLLVACMLIVLACGIPSFGGSPSDSASQAPGAPTQPPAQPAIVHSLIPVAGTTPVSNAHDNEESTTFEEKSVRGGDILRDNRFERPFTAHEMAYLPYIDILDASMTKDDNFFYLQIKIVGVDAASGGAKGYYGAEFDLDKDGRTEVLILAQAPLGSDWTTDGVKVYLDDNGDIGGKSSRPDKDYHGDGYETTIFDAGNGNDSDMAWARFMASPAPLVELAFKREVLQDYPTFMFSVLASATAPDPSQMFYNDTYSEERAGSPSKGDQYYPLNELAAFDNTCRLPSGFQPTGTEPYGCQIGHERNEPEIQYAPPGKKIILHYVPLYVPPAPK